MSFGFQNALFLKEIIANLMMKFISVCQTISPFQGVNSSLYDAMRIMRQRSAAGYIGVLYSTAGMPNQDRSCPDAPVLSCRLYTIDVAQYRLCTVRITTQRCRRLVRLQYIRLAAAMSMILRIFLSETEIITQLQVSSHQFNVTMTKQMIMS